MIIIMMIITICIDTYRLDTTGKCGDYKIIAVRNVIQNHSLSYQFISHPIDSVTTGQNNTELTFRISARPARTFELKPPEVH